MTETGQQFHMYELLQFLRYAANTGSNIKAEAMEQIAETLVADSSVEAAASDGERGRALKLLRAEPRSKELGLDGLIKSLIELPASTAESARGDAKASLKPRIADLTQRVNGLRDQVMLLEDAEGVPSSVVKGVQLA